jgi:hypothetical protein
MEPQFYPFEEFRKFIDNLPKSLREKRINPVPDFYVKPEYITEVKGDCFQLDPKHIVWNKDKKK